MGEINIVGIRGRSEEVGSQGMNSLKSIVTELWPLHRTLASEGTDEALRIVGRHMPNSAAYAIETYPPREPAWTWTVPERYVVHAAYLETEDGRRIADFANSPLHLVSYSQPIDAVLTWEELEPHLHCAPHRPHAIPWEFKYYERSWGFCLTKNQLDRLPRDTRYHAVIDVEFDTDSQPGFRVGTAVLGEGTDSTDGGDEILICSHLCHPCQANDGIAGVVTAIAVAQRLAERPLPSGSMAVRFLFCPETIGSICYLNRHEDLIERLNAGIVCEMTGNLGTLALQRSRQDDHLMDRIARYVLSGTGLEFREGAFGEVVSNDEMVINGPGVNVPCISISRWPYDEYHTSDDTPEIVEDDMLEEAVDVVEEIVRIYASNCVPRRRFRGPAFLSGHGLWVDWRVDSSLNRVIEKIMLRLEGDRSVFEIADELRLDYWDVWNCIGRFEDNGLIERLRIRSPADAA